MSFMKESLGWTQETSSDLLMMQLPLKLENFSGFSLKLPMVKKRWFANDATISCLGQSSQSSFAISNLSAGHRIQVVICWWCNYLSSLYTFLDFHLRVWWLRDDFQMMQLSFKLVYFSGFPLKFPMVKRWFANDATISVRFSCAKVLGGYPAKSWIHVLFKSTCLSTLCQTDAKSVILTRDIFFKLSFNLAKLYYGKWRCYIKVCGLGCPQK